MKVAVIGGIGVYAQEEVLKKAIEKTGAEVEIISLEEAEERTIKIHSLPQEEEVFEITNPYNKLNFPSLHDNFKDGKQLRRERRKAARK